LLRASGRVASCFLAASHGPQTFELTHPVLLSSGDSCGNIQAAEAEDRRHVLKVNGTRENLLDIAARIREAQRTMKAVERRVKTSGEEFSRSIEIIAAGSTRAGAPKRN
jgi:hypothetical protein